MTWPSPRLVAVCRILLGVAVMLNTSEITAVLNRVVDGALAVPGPVVLSLAASTVQVWALVSMVAGAFIALGVMTPVAALTASVFCLFAMLWDHQAYTNHFWLTTLLLLPLAFARSDARWSVRAVMKGRLESVPSTPVLLMLTQLSICYGFAALSKINPWWLAGDELRLSLRFEAPDPLYAPLAAIVIVTELFIALGIWFAHTRRLALLTGVGLHLGIVALMHDRLPLITFAMVCLSLYPLIVSAPYARDLRSVTASTGSVPLGQR
jgi:uncharacterized membrane protein YphA (DoxX/SURF4 family)